VFSCLTCNPPPDTPSDPYSPAGLCYSCSISCHGEHTLVELFNKRNFVCDCGTTRFPTGSPCTLRIDEKTGQKGGVVNETPDESNKYNQNFRNRFCCCEDEYDPHKENCTMFQCLGLGSVDDGGCGEDWYHPQCIMGLPRNKHRSEQQKAEDAPLEPTSNEDENDEQDEGIPSNFPKEDDFEYFLCYKCVDAFPWVKRYAGANGFLLPVFHNQSQLQAKADLDIHTKLDPSLDSKKRKASEEPNGDLLEPAAKRNRSSDDVSHQDTAGPKGGPVTDCRYDILQDAPSGSFSLFMKEDFREHLCDCPKHYPLLSPHAQLLQEEDTYEPPLSSVGRDDGNGSVGSKSLLDRGEAALSNVDRVRAIEGVMVYNDLKEKVKNFLRPFAESGTPVGAEDIKKYFEKLRGDADGISAAAAVSKGDGGDAGGDNRKEQSGTSRFRSCQVANSCRILSLRRSSIVSLPLKYSTCHFHASLRGAMSR
jgi:E3 ubiquitin-protein ligase UBR7